MTMPTDKPQVAPSSAPADSSPDGTLMEELVRVLKAALRQSGCDGDLCLYQWHEDARAALARAAQPAASAFLCTKCGHHFEAVPSPHNPCPRCNYSASPLSPAPADTAEMRRLADAIRGKLKLIGDGPARHDVSTALLYEAHDALRTAADALDAERAARKSDRQTANATAKKWSEEWRDEYARVKDLQRQIDEALQLDGGCSTLAELINAVTKLKFDHAETEKALDAAREEIKRLTVEAERLMTYGPTNG